MSMPLHPEDSDELTYRQEITIVVAVAVACAVLLVAALWLVEAG
jgi:hypothetical protein